MHINKEISSVTYENQLFINHHRVFSISTNQTVFVFGMYNTLVFVILCTYIVGMDMYEVKEIVGKGAFAKVYSATCMMSSCNTDILDFDYLDSADLESKLIALKVSHSEQVFVKVSL